MRRYILIVAMPVFLIAGSPATKTGSPPDSTSVSASDATAIRSLVSQIYANYSHIDTRPGVGATNPHPARIGLAFDKLFTPSTRMIANENARLLQREGGGVGDIDSDVFIDAQDNGAIKLVLVSLSSRAGGRIASIVVFDDAEMRVRAHRKTIIWERTPAGWRVYDIELKGQGTYRTVMIEENRRIRGEAKTPPTVSAPSVAPAAQAARRRAGAARRPRPGSPALVSAPPPPPVLPPFDLALSRSSPPMGDSINWSGLEVEKTSYSLAALRLTNLAGKLSGTADMRAPGRPAGPTVAVSGKVKDGICQIKIDQFGSFKGPCSAAGFLGRKSFLGDTEASLYVYEGGAAAMARGVAALPAAFGYAGKNDAAFREDEFFTLHRSDGLLVGIWRNTFSKAGVVGAVFDGSCLLVTTGAYSFEGDCNAGSFSGRQLRGGKVSTTLSLTGMTAQAVAAAIGGMEQRQVQAQAMIQRERAASEPTPLVVAATADGSSGRDAPPGTQWFYGRDRWAVAPGGGCPQQDQLMRGYCFSQVISFMRAHPSEGTQAVVALTASAPLGTFIGKDTPIRYAYVDVSRQGDGFVAKRVLHGTSKVNVPVQLAARCQGFSQRDGFVVVLGERGLREAALYPCS